MKCFVISRIPTQSGSSEKLFKLSLGMRVLFARPFTSHRQFMIISIQSFSENIGQTYKNS